MTYYSMNPELTSPAKGYLKGRPLTPSEALEPTFV